MLDRIVTFVEGGTETYPAVIRSGGVDQPADLTVFGGVVKDKRVAIREVDNVRFGGNKPEPGTGLYPYWEYARP